MRTDVAGGLRGVRKGLAAGASHRAQSVLVALEVTVTVVLLICGLLLAGSFLELTRVNTGLRTDGVVAFDVSLPRGRYPGAADHRQFVDAALGALRSMPGVESASLALAPRFSGWNFAQAIHGHDSSRATIAPLIQSVSGGYSESLGIRLESGRYLTDRDTATSPRVAVISRALARARCPEADAVGRYIRLAPANRPGAGEAEVVGVVGDVLHGSLTVSPVETLYMPVQQRPSALLTALVRSSQPDLAAASVRERRRAEYAARARRTQHAARRTSDAARRTSTSHEHVAPRTSAREHLAHRTSAHPHVTLFTMQTRTNHATTDPHER